MIESFEEKKNRHHFFQYREKNIIFQTPPGSIFRAKKKTDFHQKPTVGFQKTNSQVWPTE
jgi:hypothetical protein